MPQFQPFVALVLIIGFLAASNVMARDTTWKECELAQRDPDRSIAACSKLLRASRSQPEAFHNRGIAYAVKGDLDRALKDIGRGIELDPGRAYRWQERGEVYLRQGNFVRAIGDLNEAIRLDPTRAFRFHARGNAYRGSGELIQAIADYSEAIRLDPTKRLFRFYDRGNAFRDTGQYERALADYEIALQLEPANGWVLFERARTYAKMGQAQSARRDLDAALATDPANQELGTAIEREISNLTNTAGPAVDQPPSSFPIQADSARPRSDEQPPPLSSVAPTLRHPSHGGRVAVLVVPGSARGNARNVIAHSDEEVYRKLLRDIGFDVLTIGPSSRPDLDQALREAARRLPNGGEVALFVLGTALSDGNELYVMPADGPAEAEQQPGGLDAAGLRLGDVLRRVHARAPRRFVVIVDECRRVGSAGPECTLDVVDGTTGASIIAAHRIGTRSGSNSPLAQRTSIRELLTLEIVKEGQNFLSLFGSLKQRLEGSNIALVSTSALSTEFAFVPANYFATLPTDCNRVAPNADVNVLRTANLEPLLQACERAISTWPYTSHFSSQLAIVREQRAFQKAVASCDDRAAIAGYLATHPSGRYTTAVKQFETDCTKRLADLEEEALYKRAVASCDNLNTAAEYRRKTPNGRFIRAVQQFEDDCKARLAAAQETRDYQKAVVSCDNLSAATEYDAKYPNGRYKTEVNEFLAGCDRIARAKRAKEAAADACDRLAANPYDVRKSNSVPGVSYTDLAINASEAVQMCAIAAEGFPNELRFRYQRARALEHVDRNKALFMHDQLVRLRYPAAFDNLGWLYLTDRNNEASAIGYFRAGTDLEDPESMVSMAEMIIRGKTQARGPHETVPALYCRAAELGHVEAARACQQAREATVMQLNQQQRMLELFGAILRSIPQR